MGYNFMVSLCRVPLFIQFFVTFSCFSLFCFGCVRFSKKETFSMGLSVDFFMLHFVVVKLESGFLKKLSSFQSGFNLVWVPWDFFLLSCYWFVVLRR